MDSLFVEQDFSERKIWGYRPWLESGLVHGFCGKSFNFSEPSLAESALLLCKTFSTKRLLLLEQLHGPDLIEVSEGSGAALGSGVVFAGRGDGFIIPLNGAWQRQTAFGIRTADCLPVVFWSKDLLALVHAGWRGLAAGVLQKALKSFAGSKFEAVIFPAAGQTRYEVGSEVIAALEPFARYKPGSPGKAWLNLEETAQVIIESAAAQVQVAKSQLCTISDPLFHSFRREGRGGSNLCFVIPE